MTVLAQIVAVCEDAGLNVSGDAQHAVLLQLLKGTSAGLLFNLLADPVVEVNLELGPARLDVELVDYIAKRLRVLVFFLQVVRC